MKQTYYTLLLITIFSFLSLLIVGFINFNNKKKQNKINYDYDNNIIVIFKKIYQDKIRKIEIMQIKGHEYIVLIRKIDGSASMCHSESCFRCTNEK